MGIVRNNRNAIKRKQSFYKEELLSFFHSLDVRPLSTLLGILPPDEPFCDKYSFRPPVFNVDALLMEVGKYASDWPGRILGHRDEFLSNLVRNSNRLWRLSSPSRMRTIFGNFTPLGTFWSRALI